MKRLAFLFTFLSFYFVTFSQAGTKYNCQYGFTFELSMQKSWGYAQPIVMSVTPNTSADAAGIQIYDIIEKINDRPTAGETLETIISWLYDTNNPVRLSISNLKEGNKDYTLKKHCRLNNSLSERDLASIYSFYSLEDVQTHAFTCPFRSTVAEDINLIQYATFGFSVPNPDNIALENSINTVIRKSLEQKGLKYSENNPDIIVQTYYSHTPNPNYLNNTQAEKLPVAHRYNVHKKSMEFIPIFFNPLIHPNQAKYLLKYGIKLIDNRKKNNTAIWECEANEFLQSNYSLSDYAEFHTPLMFMQYPYIKTRDFAEFYHSRSRYNFTGLHYNMDNLKEISEVTPLSPAAQAGIQAGDIIEKINDIKFVSNTKTADNNYKQFIFKTSSLRDASTQFTNAEGFTRCMYWDKFKYVQIQDEFRKQSFSTVFAYLFYFAPYINLSGTNIVSFNIIRGKQKEEIRIKPTIFTEEIFENR